MLLLKKQNYLKYFVIEEEKDFLILLIRGITIYNFIITMNIKKEEQKSILFISHSSERGGAKLALLELVQGLKNRNYSCSVVLPAEGYMNDEPNKIGVKTYIISVPWWIFKKDEEKEMIYNQIFNSCLKIIDVISEKKFDYIYTNTCVIPQGAIISHMLNIPHIWHIHEYGEKDHGLKFLMDFKDRSKFIDSYSDKIIVNSKALKKEFDKFIDEQKSVVIYYDIKLPNMLSEKIEIFKKEKSLKLLIIGQIYPGKGQLVAVKALKKCFFDLNENVELAIIGRIGSEEYFNEIQTFIINNNLQNIITINKFNNNPTLAYEKADIVLMCSKSEAFGRVTVEAMMMGKPVIGSNSGATIEIIKENVTGLLFSVDSDEELSQRISYLYNNRNKILELGINAKNFTKEVFSDDIYSGGVSSIINNIDINEFKKKISIFLRRTAINYFELSKQLIIKNNEIQQKDQEIQQKDQEINVKNIELDQKSTQINSILSSTCWKITEPIRIINGVTLKIRNIFFFYISLIKKSIVILEEYGLTVFLDKIVNYFFNNKIRISLDGKISDYNNWIQNIEKKQKIKIYNNATDIITYMKYKPKISIILPVYNTDEIFLRKAIFSVLYQYYENWELCIVDDKSTKRIITRILDEFQKKDKRIKVLFSDKNEGISISTNKAVNMATGEFVGFLDHDDELEPEALLEVVKTINCNSKIDFIYSDDDKIDKNGFRYDPQFKPGWSPELLLSYCYVGHFKVVRKKIFEELEGFNKKFDGSQDYDFILRLSEKTDKIIHIPEILYHWRSLPGSIAQSTKEKPLSIERGRLAVKEALLRRKIKGDVIQPKFAISSNLGIFDIKYNSLDYNEKVTIIIPTKDNFQILKKCISSIKEKTNYLNYDILVINNNSVEKETYEYLEKEKIKFINLETKEFNFSKINNIAVEMVNTELILFMNNDTEIIYPDWLLQMVGTINLDNKIGAVGARLIYGDKRIQHSGVILGLNGLPAGHANKLLFYEDLGYLGYNRVMRDYSAVTAACMLTRKSLFKKCGGFDQVNLAIEYNDVDYCLKLINLNYRIVYNPNALLYHYEGYTRKNLKNNDDSNYFRNKWSNYISNDFYYNCNLSLHDEKFKIKQK